FRITELVTDFALGKGVQLQASEADIDAWLQGWWHHPQNHLPTRVYELCTELSLTGELFVAFHLNPGDRVPYLRPIPAGQIDQIETDPEDIEREMRYHRAGGPHPLAPSPAGRGGSGAGAGGSTLGVWLPAVEPGRPQPGKGPWVRHYAVNRVP